MQLMDSRFEIREAPGKGWGLFALTQVAKRDFILEYTGIKVPTNTADESGSKYLFEIDDEWTLDGEPMDNHARWINHACIPNVEAEVDDGKIMIYALRDIFPGEELLIDYGEEYYDEFIKPYGCKCGAIKHRE